MPTNVVSSICDDRGEEPTYHGVTMSALIEGEFGVGDVISLLWFKRSLPKYATRFVEMCVMLCADHGPCVSGARDCFCSVVCLQCLYRMPSEYLADGGMPRLTAPSKTRPSRGAPVVRSKWAADEAATSRPKASY